MGFKSTVASKGCETGTAPDEAAATYDLLEEIYVFAGGTSTFLLAGVPADTAGAP